MLSIKQINLKIILLFVIFIMVFFVTRIPRLESDEINPDSVNWHSRSEQFVVALKTRKFENTYQHYHPGVTLMWLVGVPIELFKQLTSDNAYNQYTFYSFHFLAKYVLVITQLFLSIFLIYLLSKIFGFYKAFYSTLLLNLEPFFVGNSRLLHMDILYTLFVFISLVLCYLCIEENRKIWFILCGFFLSLTFLTRSLGITVFIYALGTGLFFYWLKLKKPVSLSQDSQPPDSLLLPQKKIVNIKSTFIKLFPFFIFITLSFVIYTFLLFPALWKNPFQVLLNIFTEGRRIGIKNGHSEIFLGKSTENPGWLFYPVVIYLKTTPFIWIGVLLFFTKILKIIKNQNLKSEILIFRPEKKVGFFTFSGIYYLAYFLLMSWATKKIDRYMLVIFPLITLISISGFFTLQDTFKKSKFSVGTIILLFIIFYLIPFIRLFPYYFLYTNPLFGSAESANKIVAQKSFGIGIYDVKGHLQSKYGSEVEVGFIDTKPIKEIYPNRLVTDIRVGGTRRYDVIVLAINEEMPEKVIVSKDKFIKDSSLYINGLEFWRFYVKQK